MQLATAWPEQEEIILADTCMWEAAEAKTLRPKSSNSGPPDSAQYMPPRLCNRMIHSLVRHQIRGLRWHQGESLFSLAQNAI